MKITIRVITIISAICFLTLNACSDHIFSSGNSKTINGLEFEITNEEFTVRNRANQPVYYFSVERSLLVRILWLPISTEDNRINPGQKVAFPFDEELCCSEDSEISFFYWYGVYTMDDRPADYEDIPQIVIDPKTKRANKL